jgi:hypothetical protein
MSGELFKKLPFVGKPLVDEHHKNVGPDTPWTLVISNPQARLEILRDEALKVLTEVTGVRWVQSSHGCFETFIAFKEAPYSSSWDDVMSSSEELREFLGAAAKVSRSNATGCVWTALAVAGCDRYSRFAIRVGCPFVDLSWTGNFSKALREVQVYCADVGRLAREGAQRFQREIQRGGTVPHPVLDEYIDLNLRSHVRRG